MRLQFGRGHLIRNRFWSFGLTVTLYTWCVLFDFWFGPFNFWMVVK
jgi:hypothetical protein